MMSATITEDVGALMTMIESNFTTIDVGEKDTKRERLAKFILRYVAKPASLLLQSV
jgi:hypothetical protein